MKITIYTFCLSLLMSGAMLAAGSSVAVTIKVAGDSDLLRAESSAYQIIKRGDRLDLGDQIRTGNNGTVALVFQDDMSQLKIRPDTEVIIGGRRSGRDVEKMLELPLGRLWVEVTRSDTEFRIATPTSVASVKGTSFWVVVDEVGATTVVTSEGTVNLLNTQSGETADVEPGITGVSRNSGEVVIHQTTTQELEEFSQGALHEMEIPFRNDDNEQKTLKIRYYE
jgi:hypothetical protein